MYLQQCLVVTWLVPRDMFHPAFCHVDTDVCIYSTVFGGQVDAGVDNVQLHELVHFVWGIALYESYYYY